jgi:hypothetical protein
MNIVHYKHDAYTSQQQKFRILGKSLKILLISCVPM